MPALFYGHIEILVYSVDQGKQSQLLPKDYTYYSIMWMDAAIKLLLLKYAQIDHIFNWPW